MSTHSFEDCYAKQTEVRCLNSQECVTASAHAVSGVKDEGYVKGCAATCLASDIPICNGPNVKCDVKCCSSDYCNVATGRPPTTAPFQSFECYECLSTHSFQDCDKKRSKVKCSTACIKMKAYTLSGTKREAYFKTCAVSDNLGGCNHPNIKCKVNRCLSDLCNGSSGPVVSGLLLGTAIVYLLGLRLLLPDI